MLLDAYKFLTMGGDLCFGARCRKKKICLRYILFVNGVRNRLVMCSCIGYSKFEKIEGEK